MIKASELKKGAVVDIDGGLYITRNIDVRSPSARGASTLYKVRFLNVRSGQKLEQTLKGEDMLNDAELVRRSVQYSYRDDDMIIFMDDEDYSQYTLSESDVADELVYISEGLGGIKALLVEGQIIGIELPAAVVMKITDTAPAMKAASASARSKPATLATGLEIQVPEYLVPGESIKVNTLTGEFISRA